MVKILTKIGLEKKKPPRKAVLREG